MVKGLLAFLVGVYSGIYVSQIYNVPRVDDPRAIFERVKEFADKHKKD
ncbi:hypothetical protein D910_10496 [Dendroctonus ponderosae]|uniref:Uncharacterized protein n=1 Tax=Dendroctonus ponderosae TaxID=77166 RepID=U4UGU1_DENPD|nr:hypothetical protein D910_10496 [Dendroctonus ponderosae]